MSTYLLVFFLQFFYIIIKFMGIRQVVGNNLNARLLITSIASTIWLVTTSVGVNGMIQGDYLVIIPYLLATLVGVYLENKIRRKI